MFWKTRSDGSQFLSGTLKQSMEGGVKVVCIAVYYYISRVSISSGLICQNIDFCGSFFPLLMD